MPRANVPSGTLTFAALGAGASVVLLALAGPKPGTGQVVTHKPATEQRSHASASAEASQPGLRVVYAGPRVTRGDTTWADPPKAPAKQGVAQAPALPGDQEAERSTHRATEAAAPAVLDATNRVAPVSAPNQAQPENRATVSLVDLNTATLEELNALNGGGLIGRAIIRGRPYQSPDELLHKRVLNRATFERIKDQVAVR